MENEHPSTSSGNNKRRWNAFVIENNGSFLQSWEWGEFQESLGRKVWRLGDCENWAALVVRHDLPLGKNYLYCPGGPVISNLKSQIRTSSSQARAKPQLKCQNFLEEIKNIAVKEKSIFLKIEPFWRKDNEILNQVQDDIVGSGFVKSDGGQRILKTLVLDLNKTEEELLVEMKQKTRYNIRLAEKHGVKIRTSNETEKDIEYFWQLARETSERDGFKIHPREHYEKIVDLFGQGQSVIPNSFRDLNDETLKQVQGDNIGKDFGIKLFLAEYRNKIIAANIVVFFGDRAIYLHGVSSNEFRNLMAPYLLQWDQIKEAKKRGCEIYDFWGIDEEKWPGITKFKKGFGGKEVSYIGAYDFVFDKKWYLLYKIAKRARC